MEKIVIEGGRKLVGEVTIGGAKNAVLAILPATILAGDLCRIENVPEISDVTMIFHILKQLGAEVKLIKPGSYEINTKNIVWQEISHELTRHLRGSYYFVGAMLGRFGRARVAMPGGCDFGARPIDLHIRGFEALGADATIEANAMVDARADSLQGSLIYMDLVSVGATANIILASVLAEGTTTIENAAREPHIVDLANFLIQCGADIRGAGTDVIKIHGVKSLHGCDYSVIPDQIEAGTYMVAAAATSGKVVLKNVIYKHLESIAAKLRDCGAEIIENEDGSVVVEGSAALCSCKVKTLPHPGFPTDMQPQITALLSVADGTSIISETVYDNRFRYVEQLSRMGADISVNGKIAVVVGVERLMGAPIKAVDLRAGAAMLIAGLMAEGVTEIEDIEHIDRGYEDVVKKLSRLGANIKRVNFPEPNTIPSAV